MVGPPEQPESLECQGGAHRADFRDTARDEARVATGRDHRETPHAEFGAKAADQSADQASVAVDRADQHGCLGVLAND